MKVRINPWIYTQMPSSIQCLLNMHKLEAIKDCVFTLIHKGSMDGSRYSFYTDLVESERRDYRVIREQIPWIQSIVNKQVPIWYVEKNPTIYDYISEWLLVPFTEETPVSIY